jgi:hypothetical protein
VNAPEKWIDRGDLRGNGVHGAFLPTWGRDADPNDKPVAQTGIPVETLME